jgi:hypothetical protein
MKRDVKRSNNIERWMWLKFNKKEPGLTSAYTVLVAQWSIPILFIMTGLLFLTIPFDEGFIKTTRMYIQSYGTGIILIISAIYLTSLNIKIDKKSGFSEILKERAIKSWHKKRKEYGIE